MATSCQSKHPTQVLGLVHKVVCRNAAKRAHVEKGKRANLGGFPSAAASPHHHQLVRLPVDTRGGEHGLKRYETTSITVSSAQTQISFPTSTWILNCFEGKFEIILKSSH